MQFRAFFPGTSRTRLHRTDHLADHPRPPESTREGHPCPVASRVPRYGTINCCFSWTSCRHTHSSSFLSSYPQLLAFPCTVSASAQYWLVVWFARVRFYHRIVKHTRVATSPTLLFRTSVSDLRLTHCSRLLESAGRNLVSYGIHPLRRTACLPHSLLQCCIWSACPTSVLAGK